jgi:ATP-dependent DNA helicase RecQ
MPTASQLVELAIKLAAKERDDQISNLQRQIDELNERLRKIEGEDYDEDLYEILRADRNRIANELNLAPYCILYNSVLEDISRKKPSNIEQLKQIKGIKDAKAEKYGARIIELVNQYVSPKQTVVTMRL